MTLSAPTPQEPVLLPRRRYAQGDEPFVSRLTEEELREFLENSEDLQRTIDLWDKISGVPGLLETVPRPVIRQQHGGPGPHKSGSSQDVHGRKGPGASSTSSSGVLESLSDKYRVPVEYASRAEVTIGGDLSTAYFDKKRGAVLIDREWAEQASPQELEGVIAHESWHAFEPGVDRDLLRELLKAQTVEFLDVAGADMDFDERVRYEDDYRELIWELGGVTPYSNEYFSNRVLGFDRAVSETLAETARLRAAGRRTGTFWDGVFDAVITSRKPVKLNRSLFSLFQNARRLAEIFFDAAAGVWRYVVAGRRVPDFRISMGVERVANAVQRDLRDLTARMVNGELSRAQWYATMRETMKQEYRAAYLAAIGGTANYDRSEIARFGWAMRPHYRWLDNFLSELESGKQPMNGFAVMRAGMYARAANAIYQNTRMNVAGRSGFREARRKLGPNEQHCEESSRPGCIELAARGWMPIADMVPIGGATCLSHCLCGLEFRK